MEVIVTAAILAGVAAVFLGTLATISRFHQKDMLIIKGELLAEEGLEVLRFYKKDNWATLAAIPSGSTKYLTLTGSTWSMTDTPEMIDGVFSRSFQVFDVMRDGADNIVSTGGTIDPNIRLFRMTVDWMWRSDLVTSSYSTYMTTI
jgi:hypothetical protein